MKVPVSIEKPKRSGNKAAKNIIKIYDKIRREKTFKKIVDANEKRKKRKKIEIVEDIKNFAAKKKNAKITADKILKKYKSMKRPKKTYLVNEEDIETIDYNELPEDLFEGESILRAANKVLDFEAFKIEQERAMMLENSLKKKAVKIVRKLQLKKFLINTRT